jgi:hypothetical protein
MFMGRSTRQPSLRGGTIPEVDVWGGLGGGGDTRCDRRLDGEVDTELVTGWEGVVVGECDTLGARRVRELYVMEDRRLLRERLAIVILRPHVVLHVRIPDFIDGTVRTEKDAIATKCLQLSP